MNDLDSYVSWSSKLCRYIDKYQSLLDSYIIEFFTESHWDKLPTSWQETLNQITLHQFCIQLNLCHKSSSLLQSNQSPPKVVILPLSLLAFSATANMLSYQNYPNECTNTSTGNECTASSTVDNTVDSSIKANTVDNTMDISIKANTVDSSIKANTIDISIKANTKDNTIDSSIKDSTNTCGKVSHGDSSINNCSQVLDLKHLFRRHVKLKKQHEIKELTKVIQKICRESKTNHVIDLGCGQGHLARCLAYHCGYHVTAVEAVGCHLENAMQYDKQVTADIEKELKAKNQEEFKSGSIHYIGQLIQPDIEPDRLMSVLLSSSVEDHHQSCVLVGLHSCGDLSSTMLRLFSKSDRGAGLVSVGCCYMKLSHNDTSNGGYPMSVTLASHELSYEGKELACHSKEVYVKRLEEGSEHLKIHCWRAAVETILRKHGLRKPHVKIPSSASKRPFKEYAIAVLQSVGLVLTQDDMDNMNQLIDEWWERVVMYFLLRLKMAPCVETLILIDRVLFLKEKGINCHLYPVFDPLLSPRNLVLTAVK